MTGIERWEIEEQERIKSEYYRKADEHAKQLRSRLSKLMADNAGVLREIDAIKAELNPPNPYANVHAQFNAQAQTISQYSGGLLEGLLGSLGGALG